MTRNTIDIKALVLLGYCVLTRFLLLLIYFLLLLSMLPLSMLLSSQLLISIFLLTYISIEMFKYLYFHYGILLCFCIYCIAVTGYTVLVKFITANVLQTNFLFNIAILCSVTRIFHFTQTILYS